MGHGDGIAGRLEQLNLNTEAQSVCLGVDAQLLLVASTSDVQWVASKLLLNLLV
jgi:hypothetical protein